MFELLLLALWVILDLKENLTIIIIFLQVRSALSSEAIKAGIPDTPDAIFSYLIERVRNNLHIILCMSPVGDPFRYYYHEHMFYSTICYLIFFTLSY